jgi:hypothetical protein
MSLISTRLVSCPNETARLLCSNVPLAQYIHSSKRYHRFLASCRVTHPCVLRLLTVGFHEVGLAESNHFPPSDASFLWLDEPCNNGGSYLRYDPFNRTRP